MRDLHALIREEGIQQIADTLTITVRCLTDLRRGESPMTVDDLYTLSKKYRDFDVLGTISRIGQKRRRDGKISHPRSYKIKKGQKWFEGPGRLKRKLNAI